jgi:hypothetical protein
MLYSLPFPFPVCTALRVEEDDSLSASLAVEDGDDGGELK